MCMFTCWLVFLALAKKKFDISQHQLIIFNAGLTFITGRSSSSCPGFHGDLSPFLTLSIYRAIAPGSFDICLVLSTITFVSDVTRSNG